MQVSRIVSNSAVISLSVLQHKILVDLPEEEHKHAITWRAFLNRTHYRGELPDRVKIQGIGSHPDLYQMDEARITFNSALFGKRENIRLESEPVFVISFLGRE